MGAVRVAVLLASVAALCECGSRSDLESTQATVSDSAAGCDPSAPFATPVPIEGEVNTADDETDFRLSRDELTAFFTRTIGIQTAIYETRRATLDAPFATSTPVTSTLAPHGDAGFPSYAGSPNVTDDLLALIYASGSECNPEAVNLDLPNALCTVRRSSPSSTFGSPQPIAIGNSAKKVLIAAPFILNNGSRLYIDNLGFLNGYGIVTSSRPTLADDFAMPALLDIEFDGDASVIRPALPVLTADERVLYFDRAELPPVFGNIWRATRATSSEAFSHVELVAELASPFGEQATWASADGCRLYMSREVGSQSDIFVASRPRK